MRNEGHELGNHTWYNKTSLLLSSEELSRQICELDKILFTGKEPKIKWFRPGFGYYNSRILQVVRDCGYRTVLGDVYPHDYYLPFPILNGYFITSRVRPGSIVILHDLDYSVKTLDIILPELKKKGYTITTLSGLIDHDKKANNLN